MFEDIYRFFLSFNYTQVNRISDFFIFSDQIHVFWEGEISWPIKAIINCIGGKKASSAETISFKRRVFSTQQCSLFYFEDIQFDFLFSLTHSFFYSYERSLNAFSDLQV